MPTFLYLGSDTTAALCCPSYAPTPYTMRIRNANRYSANSRIMGRVISVPPPSHRAKLLVS